ncbi:NAD(P)/FAD-dependent oxidoreductase [Candidatus Giovannonibacteria bacterium]|nr:NAD(P)/FAD-dependent oxidoreductase [Candidatus Giovannonibacteria bacterium]
MKSVRYLIIGGGIAGTTAAETIRLRDKEGSISIISDEPARLYSRIMLSKPNFFLEKISFDQIWLKTDSWYQEKNIELLLGKRAVSLNPALKKIVLDGGTEIIYEKLLLAYGGETRKWELKIPVSGVHYLRSLADAKEIIDAVKMAKKAVVVGGGFVSFEMCEMLRLAGLEVSLVMREKHFWSNLLDEASGAMIEKALETRGVKIYRESEVGRVLWDETVEEAILKNGESIPCDLIIVGIGLNFKLDWIKNAGIETGRGILANEYLETNLPDIWTAGDIAEFKDLILGERVQLGNWVNAQMQGRRAALNMTGEHVPFKMVSFYTTTAFGINVAFIGDVRPLEGRQIITRGNPENGWYSRIILKDDEIIGATLINRTAELAPISKLIENDINISGHETDLANPAFELKTLVS